MSNGNNEELEFSSNPEEFWEELFARFHAADVPEDFMCDRPMNQPPDPHGIFDDEL